MWNGTLEWNTGMEYWNGFINANKLSYFINNWSDTDYQGIKKGNNVTFPLL